MLAESTSATRSDVPVVSPSALLGTRFWWTSGVAQDGERAPPHLVLHIAIPQHDRQPGRQFESGHQPLAFASTAGLTAGLRRTAA